MVWGPYPAVLRALCLALCLVVFRRPYLVLGIEPMSVACKKSCTVTPATCHGFYCQEVSQWSCEINKVIFPVLDRKGRDEFLAWESSAHNTDTQNSDPYQMAHWDPFQSWCPELAIQHSLSWCWGHPQTWSVPGGSLVLSIQHSTEFYMCSEGQN